MNAKFETLHTIYFMVKNNPNPAKAMLKANELILQQSLAWDEVVKNVTELEKEGYVKMHHPALFISITEKGVEYMQKHASVYGLF